MPAPHRSKKRGSSKANKSKISPKRRRSPTRASKKRVPAKKRRKRQKKSAKKRSASAKKGWAKRRKKQRLLESMADIRMRKAAEIGGLPPGWIEHRRQLRLHDGEIWRRVEHEFDQAEYDAVRLQALEDLDIDFATRDELYDYLSWLANELEIDISDMYRMYLGYGVGQVAD